MSLFLGFRTLDATLPGGTRRKGLAHLLALAGPSGRHLEGSFAVDEGRAQQIINPGGPGDGTSCREIGGIDEVSRGLTPTKPMTKHCLFKGWLDAGFDLVECPSPNPDTRRKDREWAREPIQCFHDPILDDLSNEIKGEFQRNLMDHPSMDGKMMHGWLKRERFRFLVDRWLEGHEGTTKAILAKRIGIAESSLITYYSGKREPGKKTINLICKFFFISPDELIDNPGAEIPGVPLETTSKLTPAKRLILRSFAQKIGPDDVTDESAEQVWKAVDELINLGKIPPQR